MSANNQSGRSDHGLMLPVAVNFERLTLRATDRTVIPTKGVMDWGSRMLLKRRPHPIDHEYRAPLPKPSRLTCRPRARRAVRSGLLWLIGWPGLSNPAARA